MQCRGFIFSLDAFVAFLLIMLTISLLLFTISTPNAFYPSLEQAHTLAHDTLYALATTTDNPAQGTYLEQILSGGDAGPILAKVAGGPDPSNPGNVLQGIIPDDYAYKLEAYTFDPNANTQQPWKLYYDTGPDATTGACPSTDHCRAFSKLSASATIFASLYDSTPKQGESPYCYVNCHGYVSDGNYQSTCTQTPCDVEKSNFDAGKNTIQMVRLTVYT